MGHDDTLQYCTLSRIDVSKAPTTCLQGETFPTLKMNGAFSTVIHLKKTATLPRE
jgi:hypothetical protein